VDMDYIKTYKEVKQLQAEGFRGFLRNQVLDILSFFNTSSRIEEAFRKPRIHFLYIHHVFQDEENQFRKLLAVLAKSHVFISYSEAVDRILKGEIDRPYMVFSSDDGLKNNLRAVQILNEFGAKACFFINPDIIGENNPDKIKKFCDQQLMFPLVEFMDWKDVENVLKAGHEIGAHTMNHINIADASKEIIEEDMQKSHAFLLKNCGKADHFAFPYGRFFHFNEMGRKACFEAGFISCASAERGAHVASLGSILPEKLLIRRDHLALGWEMSHLLYFITKSAKSAKPANNYFPYQS